MGLIDYNNNEIKECDILTFDWFDRKDPIEDMRRKFSNMENMSNGEIYDKIHEPTFIVKSKNGVLYGEGINKKLYLHSFRFKYTKKLDKDSIEVKMILHNKLYDSDVKYRDNFNKTIDEYIKNQNK